MANQLTFVDSELNNKRRKNRQRSLPYSHKCADTLEAVRHPKEAILRCIKLKKKNNGSLV